MLARLMLVDNAIATRMILSRSSKLGALMAKVKSAIAAIVVYLYYVMEWVGMKAVKKQVRSRLIRLPIVSTILVRHFTR